MTQSDLEILVRLKLVRELPRAANDGPRVYELTGAGRILLGAALAPRGT